MLRKLLAAAWWCARGLLASGALGVCLHSPRRQSHEWHVVSRRRPAWTRATYAPPTPPPSPNAYTLAINGKRPFIVVHTALVELLSPQELKVRNLRARSSLDCRPYAGTQLDGVARRVRIRRAASYKARRQGKRLSMERGAPPAARCAQAVIAHELAHVACDHGVWLTLANVLANGTVSLLPVISGEEGRDITSTPCTRPVQRMCCLGVTEPRATLTLTPAPSCLSRHGPGRAAEVAARSGAHLRQGGAAGGAGLPRGRR